MKKTFIYLMCALTFSNTGCLHPKIGPQSLPRDRALYSTGLADSWKEQMLLNIVKLRYIDPPTFVDIGSIVASYTLTQSAALGGTIIPTGPSGSNSLTLGGSGTFSNSPTITYTPLTGSKFIQGLLTPLPPEAVFTAIQNGVPADMIMLSTLFSINGLKNQQATLDGVTPADQDFDKVRALARQIQLSGAVRTYVKKGSQGGPATVVTFRTAGIPPEILEDIKEMRRLLKLNPDATEFSLAQSPVSSSDTELAVLTRSVIGVMQNMAANVEVPAEDLAKNHAFPGFEKDRNLRDAARLIHIHSGKEKSDDAFVGVRYEGNWFWIDKGDLRSKQVFQQLILLFTMANTAPPENQPVVTIPAR